MELEEKEKKRIKKKLTRAMKKLYPEFEFRIAPFFRSAYKTGHAEISLRSILITLEENNV
jgi:hypothetical protein